MRKKYTILIEYNDQTFFFYVYEKFLALRCYYIALKTLKFSIEKGYIKSINIKS